MPSDDSKFENYLKSFRQLPPSGLLVPDIQPERRFRFWWVWAFSAATLLVAALLLTSIQSRRREHSTVSHTAEHCVPPLTLGTANTRLFNAQSAREALDELAFPSQIHLREGETSALEELGKEKTKL